jgi:two-component system sensor histidine kinase RegB
MRANSEHPSSEPKRPEGLDAHWVRNLAWLARLRWLALLAQAGAVLLLPRLFGATVDTWPLLGVIAGTALSNVALVAWLRRAPRVDEWMLASVMALDFMLLTALLQLSGGASNPFTVLYLVHIALAAVVLHTRYAWFLSALASGCFFALFVLPSGHAADPMAGHQHHQMAGGGEMSMHLRGMWVAFAVAASAIAYFVTRVTKDLDQQRALAAEAHLRALRSEKLASLATLAAGAAHELSTPLGTIAILAKELERNLGKDLGTEADCVADARLIREEVERCKHILRQMASDAGESAGEAFADTPLTAMCARALEGVADANRVKLDLPDLAVHMPPRAFAGAFRGLIRNALQASTDDVDVRATQQGSELWIEVVDRGQGMPADVLSRVGEPFFTTKETGRGMGLGVFLARALTERLGGALELSSEVGKGTRARVVLPQTALAKNQVRSAV